MCKSTKIVLECVMEGRENEDPPPTPHSSNDLLYRALYFYGIFKMTSCQYHFVFIAGCMNHFVWY